MRTFCGLSLLLAAGCSGGAASTDEAPTADESRADESRTDDSRADESRTDDSRVDESDESGAAASRADEASRERGVSSDGESESDDVAPNFLVTFHCLEHESPCVFEWGRVSGLTRIDLGSGHPSPPEILVTRQSGEGSASVAGQELPASEPRRARGVPRRSLAEGAYFLPVHAEGTDFVLRLEWPE